MHVLAGFAEGRDKGTVRQLLSHQATCSRSVSRSTRRGGGPWTGWRSYSLDETSLGAGSRQAYHAISLGFTKASSFAAWIPSTAALDSSSG